jgi:hypothetical protein
LFFTLRSCKSPLSGLLLAPPLLHSQGGSRSLVNVRNPFRYSPLIAAIAQPFSSRLFFLCLRTLSDPQLKEIRKFSAINPKNKKGRKFKFQADKKARVYKRLVPHRPCFFASFHLMESFLFFPFFFWKNNVVRVFSFI